MNSTNNTTQTELLPPMETLYFYGTLVPQLRSLLPHDWLYLGLECKLSQDKMIRMQAMQGRETEFLLYYVWEDYKEEGLSKLFKSLGVFDRHVKAIELIAQSPCANMFGLPVMTPDRKAMEAILSSHLSYYLNEHLRDEWRQVAEEADLRGVALYAATQKFGCYETRGVLSWLKNRPSGLRDFKAALAKVGTPGCLAALEQIKASSACALFA